MLFGKKFRTQLPQAVGAAYSLKMDGKSACVVTFCGDGGTSEVSDDEYEPSLLSNNRIVTNYGLMPFSLLFLVYI